jgi:hypothetical protein
MVNVDRSYSFSNTRTIMHGCTTAAKEKRTSKTGNGTNWTRGEGGRPHATTAGRRTVMGGARAGSERSTPATLEMRITKTSISISLQGAGKSERGQAPFTSVRGQKQLGGSMAARTMSS